MFITHSEVNDPTIALIVSADEVSAIADFLYNRAGSTLNGISPKWIIASLGLETNVESSWRKFFRGSILIEPHMPELGDFKAHFLKALQVR